MNACKELYLEKAFFQRFESPEEIAEHGGHGGGDVNPVEVADTCVTLETGFACYTLMRHLIDYSDEFAVRVTPAGDGEGVGAKALPDTAEFFKSVFSNVTDFVPMDMLGLQTEKTVSYAKAFKFFSGACVSAHLVHHTQHSYRARSQYMPSRNRAPRSVGEILFRFATDVPLLALPFARQAQVVN